jgi:hypothetical protein
MTALLWDVDADTEYYWKVKGVGRIVILCGIAIYGAGLLMLRMELEQQEELE